MFNENIANHYPINGNVCSRLLYTGLNKQLRHVKKVDTLINCALRIVSGVVDPTEVEWLYVKQYSSFTHLQTRSGPERV